MASKHVLHNDLKVALEKVRAKRNFDVQKWVEKKTALVNEYFTKNGLSGAVVNMSGGIDSSVTAALLLAAGKVPNSPLKKVLGILQPIHSTPSIQARATEVAGVIGLQTFTVNQTPIFDTLSALVESESKLKGSDFAKGQLRSYMRTPVAFFTAQLLSSNGNPAVVVGTGNKDEDGYLFYFCKAGDGVADIQLIADIHKSEVFAVGKYLGLPKSVLEAAPSADLWDGQTDEDEIGAPYDFVELYTELLEYPADEKNAIIGALSAEGLAQYTASEKKVVDIHNRNKHKEKYPLNLNIL